MLVELARAESLLNPLDACVNTTLQARHVDVAHVLGGEKIIP